MALSFIHALATFGRGPLSAFLALCVLPHGFPCKCHKSLFWFFYFWVSCLPAKMINSMNTRVRPWAQPVEPLCPGRVLLWCSHLIQNVLWSGEHGCLFTQPLLKMLQTVTETKTKVVHLHKKLPLKITLPINNSYFIKCLFKIQALSFHLCAQLLPLQKTR